jgi:hypothetical protein
MFESRLKQKVFRVKGGKGNFASFVVWGLKLNETRGFEVANARRDHFVNVSFVPKRIKKYKEQRKTSSL